MRWLGYIVFLVTQIAVFSKLDEMPGPPDLGLGYLLILAVMAFIAIFLHEIGHAIAVWMLGGTVLSINVAFIRYDFAKRKFEPASRLEDREIGGYVAYNFDERWWTIRKDILVSAAGPLANLLTGLMALLLAFAASPSIQPYAEAPVAVASAPTDAPARPFKIPRMPTDQQIERAIEYSKAIDRQERNQVLLFAFAILSFGLALANLVPFKGSDGNAIYSAARQQRRRP